MRLLHCGISILPLSASLIGRSGSNAFRLLSTLRVDVAHGLVLLFGIGTRALPSDNRIKAVGR